MTGFSIQLSPFGGHEVELLVKEMPAVAARLGVYVTSDINGIHVMAGPDDAPAVLWGNYERTRDRKGRFASGNVSTKSIPS